MKPVEWVVGVITHDGSRYGLERVRKRAWVKRLMSDERVEVLFVKGDAEKTHLEGDILYLDVKESYANFAKKTAKFLEYVCLNYDFEHVVKCDDDIVLGDADKVLEYMLPFDYFGRFVSTTRYDFMKWSLEKDVDVDVDKFRHLRYAEGPFYKLSADAAKKVADEGGIFLERYLTHLGGCEDLMVGEILAEVEGLRVSDTEEDLKFFNEYVMSEDDLDTGYEKILDRIYLASKALKARYGFWRRFTRWLNSRPPYFRLYRLFDARRFRRFSELGGFAWVCEEKKLGFIPVDDPVSQAVRKSLQRLGGIRQVPAGSFGKMEGFYRFAVVSNPYSRLAWFYDRYFREGLKEQDCEEMWLMLCRYYLRLFEKGMGEDEFVESVCHIPDEVALKWFRSQKSMLYSKDGVCLVDDVYKSDEISGAEEKLDWLDFDIIKTEGDTSERFSQRSRRLIRKRYADDFETFGY